MYFFISSASQSAKEISLKYMNSICSENCVKSIIDGKLQCSCGEDIGIFNWTWAEANSSNAQITNSNKDILFHPLYSSGTAAVRGDTAFQPNLHYYWEIKMTSNLYGTDVMVGVGTSKIILSNWKFKFCSMLGIDSESWGYSYNGKIQHNHLATKYGSQFGFGSIIGIHLNMCNGTLEYYVNRKPMGIAFRGLKDKELYPMVSSTAAQSAMRIICSVSEEPTLQMRCLEYISKHPVLYRRYKEIPGLVRLYQRKYFWIVPKDEHDMKRRVSEPEEICPRNYKSFLKRNKSFHSICWSPPKALHVRKEYESDRDDTDTEPQSSSADRSIVTIVTDGSSSSSSSQCASSTPEQYCDGTRRKIRKTDSEKSAS